MSILGGLAVVAALCGGVGALITPSDGPAVGSEPSAAGGSPPQPDEQRQPSAPLPPVLPSPESLAPATIPPAPTLEPLVVVTRVVDGDTIDTTAGRIRLIGIDTPERGECNADAATAALRTFIASAGGQVRLVPGAREDADRYGRLLRYVEAPDGTDLNLELIATGLAVSRYDSRDGYGTHPREPTYIAADVAAEAPSC
jgi:endonuclease YncB( thermonuclease family)